MSTVHIPHSLIFTHTHPVRFKNNSRLTEANGRINGEHWNEDLGWNLDKRTDLRLEQTLMRVKYEFTYITSIPIRQHQGCNYGASCQDGRVGSLSLPPPMIASKLQLDYKTTIIESHLKTGWTDKLSVNLVIR